VSLSESSRLFHAAAAQTNELRRLSADNEAHLADHDGQSRWWRPTTIATGRCRQSYHR